MLAYLVFSSLSLPSYYLVDIGALGDIGAVARRRGRLLVHVALVHNADAGVIQRSRRSSKLARWPNVWARVRSEDRVGRRPTFEDPGRQHVDVIGDKSLLMALTSQNVKQASVPFKTSSHFCEQL
jgi:hypothetical protein